jgi:hypothetical protein
MIYETWKHVLWYKGYEAMAMAMRLTQNKLRNMKQKLRNMKQMYKTDKSMT